MGTPNPNARGEDRLWKELKALRADQEQIRRLLQSMPRPAVAAPAGSIVGMAQVVSVPGSVQMDSGGGYMTYNAVTYGTPTDPNAGTNGAHDLDWISVSGYELVLTEGYYLAVCHFNICWESSYPTWYQPMISNSRTSADTPHRDGSVYPVGDVNASGSKKGAYRYFGGEHGSTFVEEGGTLHAEFRHGATTAPYTNVGIYPTNTGGLAWTITKLT